MSTSSILPKDISCLRVWLVHDWLNGMRGGERVLHHLVKLFPQGRIATLFHVPGTTHRDIESRIAMTSFLQRFKGINTHYRNLLPILPAAIRSMKLPPCDVVISTSHCVAKGITVPPGVPHFCYCFTPMRYVWNMQDHYLQARSLKGMAARLLVPPLRNADLAMNENISRFATTCHNVRERIEKYYHRRSEVIYPGIDAEYYHPPTDSRQDFYLIVSALVPYKRVDLAVEMFCRPEHRHRQLVIIGKGPDEERLQTRAAEAKNIRFLGWQADETVRWHYQHARAFLFPGEEDFGLTPLEAGACGAPTIAYARGGVLETITPETGLFFQEQTVEALAEAVKRFEARAGDFDTRKLHEHAAAFSWERFRNQVAGSVQALIR